MRSALVIVALSLAASLAVCWLAGTHLELTFIVMLIAVLFVSLFLAPLHSLLAIAAIVAVLVPIRSLPVPEFLNVISPSLVIVLVWLARILVTKDAWIGRERSKFAVVLTAILLVWLVMGTIASPYVANGVGWTLSFGVTVFLPILVGVTARERSALTLAILLAGFSLSIFAILEYIMHSNFLYGSLYERSRFPLAQKWSVYRVTTTLGHPLNNSVFFSMVLGCGLGSWLKDRRAWPLVVSTLSLVALLLTGSRGGWIAGMVAIILFVGIFVVGNGLIGFFGRAVVVMVGMALLAIGFEGASAVTSRNDSTEAVASTAARVEALDVSLEVANARDWLGDGPGTSAPATEGVGSPKLVIESSYLQLLISIGLPGLILFFGLLIWAFYRAVRARNWQGVLVLSSYLVSIAFFNFIEANRPLHILLGGCLILCLEKRQAFQADTSRSDCLPAANGGEFPISLSRLPLR